MNLLVSLAARFVNAGVLGGWIRSAVGALFVAAIAKWPVLGSIVTPDVQVELAAVLATIGVGIWSHLAKSLAARAALASAAQKTAPLLLIATLIGGSGLLNACTTQQADAVVSFSQNWAAQVDNFNRAADAVNVDVVAKTSTTAAGYCTQAKAIGQNIVRIASPNQTLLTALAEIGAALDDFCAAPPQDVATAIDTLTAAIADAKAAGG